MITGRPPVTPKSAMEQVALASRVVARAGFQDLTLGHVSVRGPDGTSMYIKRKGKPLGRVTPADVVQVAIDDPGALSAPGMHLEAVMHLEAYKARPDVGCVVHGHPIYATALGATDNRMELVSHDSLLFHDGIGLYSDSADLITTPERGRKVADALGQHRAVLLKNHGVMVVGEDVRWATLAAVTLERAIHLQLIAGSLGQVDAIPAEDAAPMFYEKYQDQFLDEYWEHWGEDLEWLG